jgi:hypothetical protein
MAIEELGFSLLGRAEEQRKQRRREREKDEKYALIGGLAELGIKFANNAMQKKADSFLQSEEFLAQRRKQVSNYGTAQNIIKDYEAASASPEGLVPYYTEQRYNKLLENFNRSYDQEEYKEGRKGLLYQEAGKWAETAVPELTKRYEQALKIKSPEDFEKIYGANQGPRSVLEWLSDGASKLFTGKDRNDMRAERLQALTKTSTLNAKDLEKVKNLVSGKAVINIATLQNQLEDYRITKDDWVETSSEDIIKPISSGGETFNHRFKVVTLKHPNKQRIEKKLVAVDEAGKKYLEQGLVGQTTKTKTTTDVFGTERTYEVTTEYTSDGIQISNSRLVDSTSASPAESFMQASPQDITAALTASSRLENILPSRIPGTSIKNSGVIEAYVLGETDPNKTSLVGTKEAYRNQIGGLAFKNASVLSDQLKVNPSTALNLGAAITLQHFNSTVDPEDLKGYLRDDKTFDAEDIDHLNNNGFSSEKLLRASNLYALDAFYAVEKADPSALMLNQDTLYSMIESAPNEFYNEFQGQPQARENIINSFMRSEPAYFFKDDEGTKLNIVDALRAVHQSLLGQGL